MFDQTQRNSLGMFFLRLHSQGIFMNEIFWGLWLFPFGLLVYRSGFLPRCIGVWLMIDCFAYLILSPIALFFRPITALDLNSRSLSCLANSRSCFGSYQRRQGTVSSFRRASAGRSLIFR